jgi:electron transport complex protein RnfC
MLVGKGQGQGSANVHAAVPGRVLRTVTWNMPGGRVNEALVIRMEGAFDRLGKREDDHTWKYLSPFEIQRLIGEAGIVEMEGSGHPVPDMLRALTKEKRPLTLVARCVFDDPWLAADYALCRERLDAVAEGAAILARASGAARVTAAISRREKALSKALLEALKGWELKASCVITGNRYPQRNRRELEIALRSAEKGKKDQTGTFFILGPATLAAVRDAVRLRRPILDRYVAVGGSAVKTPQVLRVRIGTRIGDVFAECGGFVGKPRLIAQGSPLKGRRVLDMDEPVTKTCYAVYALLEGRERGAGAVSCIGCGECRAVCPVGLDPAGLFKRFQTRAFLESEGWLRRAAECHGCGCCEAVCPSRLPLMQSIINLGKNDD